MTLPVSFGRPGALVTRILFCRTQTHYSLIDQGIVSGLGFLTGVAAARQLGLAEFGRFAVVMILASLAQGFHNALVIAPLMSLAGTPRGRSPAYVASACTATVVTSIPIAVAVMALLAGLELGEHKPVFPSLILATGALSLAQNLLFAGRRILFSLGRGGEGLAMDAARAAMLATIAGAVWLFRPPLHVDTVVWLLALVAALPSVVALWPLWRGLRGRMHVMAFLKRSWPMAKWMLPTVVTTFVQEQLVWLIVGFILGDAPVGGLRAAQYVVSLAYPFMASLENIVPAEASRVYLREGIGRLRTYIARTTLLFSPLAFGFPVIAAISAEFWLRLLFGEAFVSFAGCLRVFALVVLIVFVRDMLGYFFRATQRTRVVFEAFVLSSVTTVIVILPLIHVFGTLGAAAGIAIGNGISMVYVMVAALRARGSIRGAALR